MTHAAEDAHCDRCKAKIHITFKHDNGTLQLFKLPAKADNVPFYGRKTKNVT